MTYWYCLAACIVLLPLAVYADYKKKCSVDGEEPDLDHANVNFIFMFAPFIPLFYTENYWLNLLYLLPVYLSGMLLVAWARAKNVFPYPHPLVLLGVNLSSGLVVSVIIYFIFFHEGVLHEGESAEVLSSEALSIEDTEPSGFLSYWPYWLGIALILFTLGTYVIEKFQSKQAEKSSSLLFLLIVALPILPLFTEYYWWGLLAGFICILALTQLISSNMSASSVGGMSFVIIYFYMMAVTGSVILYAILF